jgi:hypothetical protein
MSNFAYINNDGIVTKVIVADQSFINSGAVGDPFRWMQTSYNKNFRKNFAGVGFKYDRVRDAFIPPKPYPSWILNEETCNWDAPVLYPNDGKFYVWDETTLSWKLISE